MGARVIAAASTRREARVAKRRGADASSTTTEKLTERVKALTGDQGADVCFDPVGGDLSDAALSSLGWGGRLLLVGFVGGVQQIPANRLLVKNRSALGCSLRYYRWHAPDKLLRSVEELLRPTRRMRRAAPIRPAFRATSACSANRSSRNTPARARQSRRDKLWMPDRLRSRRPAPAAIL